jgi:ABC-type glycerol-3-phosphate transport system substrate-binding protein
MFARFKRGCGILLSISLILALFPAHTHAADSANPAAAGNSSDQGILDYNNNNTYSNYMKKYEGAASPDRQVVIPGGDYSGSHNAQVSRTDYKDGTANVLAWTKSDSDSWVEWSVQVPETGLYNIALDYLIPDANSRNLKVGLQLDGQTPFNEAAENDLNKTWKDGPIKRDLSGNDITPEPTAVEMWNRLVFHDRLGMYDGDFQFYLTKGSHTIRIVSGDSNFYIKDLRLFREQQPPTYQQVEAQYEKDGFKPTTGQELKVQTENVDLKNESALVPLTDRSSSLTEPYDSYKLKLNMIGGQNWKENGQWISWKFTVPESGLYQIAFRYRQNLLQGLFSSRKIYIDGKVPFRELNTVRFPYGEDWQLKVLGDQQPYQFYLTKGEHEMRMEVVIGDISSSVTAIENSIYQLNDLFRRVIMITGTQPDTLRDYFLDQQIPDLVDVLRKNSSVLTEQARQLQRITGQEGSITSLLQTIAFQLNDIAGDPSLMPKQFKSYQSNLGALSNWTMQVQSQTLDLDYFTVYSPKMPLPAVNENLWQKMGRLINQFIASYVVDYDEIGQTNPNAKTGITVWVGTGRDQAAILKNLINNDFTPKTGINVNLQLVQGSLIEATLAGKGPDVALMVGNADPVNYAMRGALVDLSKFAGFDQVKKRFYDSAIVPFQYQNGTYALPETQIFEMMFYRKDILNQLGLKVPDTWSDFYKIVPFLERDHMDIGFTQISQTDPTQSNGPNMFVTFLYQYGGTLYNRNLTQTTFDQPVAIKAFNDFTSLYQKYQFPLTYDFYSRFRIGQMPIAFQPFTQYNLLTVAAPEINGLWGMAPIPGTPQADGSIDRAQPSASTGSIMFNKTKDKEAAWKFLQWWTGADIQAKYGIGLEMLMGPAARYPTANIEAMKMLPWSTDVQRDILRSWTNVKGVPETPGSYITAQGLQNAFRDVTISNENPYATLTYWNNFINAEMRRKQLEFGFQTNP